MGLPNLIHGFVWLVVIDPILVTIAYWMLMLIALPVVGLVSGVGFLAGGRTISARTVNACLDNGVGGCVKFGLD